MSYNSALLFDFNNDESAALACETLKELGYDTVLHDGSRMHVHLEGSDLTSALEIAQSHGGQLVEQAQINSETITDSAYSLDVIPIPAHIVNEDWSSEFAELEQPEGLHNRDDDFVYNDDIFAGPETIDYLSADVKI